MVRLTHAGDQLITHALGRPNPPGAPSGHPPPKAPRRAREGRRCVPGMRPKKAVSFWT